MDCCKRRIEEVLADREANFLSLLVLAKNRSARVLAHARKDHSLPLVQSPRVQSGVKPDRRLHLLHLGTHLHAIT